MLFQFSSGCFGVAGAGCGVAALVVLDLLRSPLEQLLGIGPAEIPRLDKGAGRHVDLADCQFGIFFPPVADTCLPGSSGSRR